MSKNDISLEEIAEKLSECKSSNGLNSCLILVILFMMITLGFSNFADCNFKKES